MLHKRCTTFNVMVSEVWCFMSKHTPGPWKLVEKDPTQSFFSHTVYGQNPPGEIYGTQGPTVASFSGGERALADARLIAAAPEMLEALELF